MIFLERAAATLEISEALFGPIAFLDAPIGIDYHQPANSLVVSYNHFAGGLPNSFARVFTNIVMSNGAPVTNVVIQNDWSGIAGLPNEVKLATVKATVSGFTIGDMFFSNGGNVGWLSADATASNLVWCVIPNVDQVEGVYLDRSGVWNNDLVVTTGLTQSKKVWRVGADRQALFIADVPSGMLGSLITLANDPAKWGPLAGKALTGGEMDQTVVAIDTSGNSSVVLSGFNPEDFRVIPAGQDLYACDPSFFDPQGGQGAIVKLPAAMFAGHDGDLIVIDEGELEAPARLVNRGLR